MEISAARATTPKTIFERITQFFAVIAGASLIALMLLTVVDVILRRFFDKPILGSIEYASLMMIPLAVMAVAWGALRKVHIIVDLFHFPKKVEQVLDTIMLFLGLSVIPVTAWRTFIQAAAAHQINLTSDTLRIPYYPFYIVMGVGFSLLTIAIIFLIIEQVTRMRQK